MLTEAERSTLRFRGGPMDVYLLDAAERASLGYAVVLLLYAYDGSFELFTPSGALRVNVS